MRKYYFIISLFFSIKFLLGQYSARTTVPFSELGQKGSTFQTTNIHFNKNKLDTNLSKTYLDSIVLFLLKSPTAIVEIQLTLHPDVRDHKYGNSKEGQKRTQNFVDYLVKSRQVDEKRIVAGGIYCGHPVITDIDTISKPKHKQLWTTIRVLSFDYRTK